MASLELLECVGCGLQKIRQDQKCKLRSPAISGGGARLDSTQLNTAWMGHVGQALKKGFTTKRSLYWMGFESLPTGPVGRGAAAAGRRCGGQGQDSAGSLRLPLQTVQTLQLLSVRWRVNVQCPLCRQDAGQAADRQSRGQRARLQRDRARGGGVHVQGAVQVGCARVMGVASGGTGLCSRVV